MERTKPGHLVVFFHPETVLSVPEIVTGSTPLRLADSVAGQGN